MNEVMDAFEEKRRQEKAELTCLKAEVERLQRQVDHYEPKTPDSVRYERVARLENELVNITTSYKFASKMMRDAGMGHGAIEKLTQRLIDDRARLEKERDKLQKQNDQLETKVTSLQIKSDGYLSERDEAMEDRDEAREFIRRTFSDRTIRSDEPFWLQQIILTKNDIEERDALLAADPEVKPGSTESSKQR